MPLELMNSYGSVNVPVAPHPEANCILIISFTSCYVIICQEPSLITRSSLFPVDNTCAILNNFTNQEQLIGEVRNKSMLAKH